MIDPITDPPSTTWCMRPPLRAAQQRDQPTDKNHRGNAPSVTWDELSGIVARPGSSLYECSSAAGLGGPWSVKPVTTQTDRPGRAPHTRTRTSDTTGRLTRGQGERQRANRGLSRLRVAVCGGTPSSAGRAGGQIHPAAGVVYAEVAARRIRDDLDRVHRVASTVRHGVPVAGRAHHVSEKRLNAEVCRHHHDSADRTTAAPRRKMRRARTSTVVARCCRSASCTGVPQIRAPRVEPTAHGRHGSAAAAELQPAQDSTKFSSSDVDGPVGRCLPRSGTFDGQWRDSGPLWGLAGRSALPCGSASGVQSTVGIHPRVRTSTRGDHGLRRALSMGQRPARGGGCDGRGP